MLAELQIAGQLEEQMSAAYVVCFTDPFCSSMVCSE